jgi:hypothetical protein
MLHSFELGSTLCEATLAYNEVEKWAKTENAKFSLNFWAKNQTNLNLNEAVITL